MTNNFLPTLQNLGLTEKQAKIYLACLELGRASIVQIAKKAQIKRTTVYNIIESLLEQRLLAKFEDEKGQKFLAESPEKLAGVLKQKQTEFKQILPNLLAIANTGSDLKPEVKFYQGQEGLKAVYEDTLISGEKGDEILSYASADDIFAVLPFYAPFYLQKRIKKGIKMRALVRDSEMAQKHQRRDAKELRQTILLPKDKFNLTIEKNIYANKVALMSFRGWPMGIIIKSNQIVNSERIIFELLWKNLSNS